jgi:hypothetical protein
VKTERSHPHRPFLLDIGQGRRSGSGPVSPHRSNQESETIMTGLTTSTVRSLVGLMDMLGAAFSVSSAVRYHRRPSAEDLRRLGINEADFPTRF